MKSVTKFFAVLITGLVISINAFAQPNATATAVILTPLSVAATSNLSFGNIIAGTGGTVTIAPNSDRSSTGVTLPAANPGTISAAQFTVTGTGTSTFTIAVPATHTITRVAGTETMTVGTFVSDPTPTGALVGGTATVRVGATLTVGNAQAAGTYTNATGFTITVNYN